MRMWVCTDSPSPKPMQGAECYGHARLCRWVDRCSSPTPVLLDVVVGGNLIELEAGTPCLEQVLRNAYIHPSQPELCTMHMSIQFSREQQAESAAVLLQSWYRGHLARRKLQCSVAKARCSVTEAPCSNKWQSCWAVYRYLRRLHLMRRLAVDLDIHRALQIMEVNSQQLLQQHVRGRQQVRSPDV